MNQQSPGSEFRRAVIIGSSRYRDAGISDEPTVEASARALTGLLAADPLWAAGISPPLIDPVRPHDIMDAVAQAAAGVAEHGTLLVFFIGHAEFWRDPTTSDLYLAVGDSRRAAEWSYLGLRYVFRAMRAARSAEKLLILDCCNAGMAREFGRSVRGRHGLSETELEGSSTCVITATSGGPGGDPANARRPEVDRDQYTAFTGYFIDVLRDGLADGPAVLSVEDVVNAVTRRLTGGQHPTPGVMGYSQGKRIKVIHNRQQSDGSSARRTYKLRLLESLQAEELAAVWGGFSRPDGLEAGDVDEHLPVLIDRLSAGQVAVLAHGVHSSGEAVTLYQRWSGRVLEGDPQLVGAVVATLRTAGCPQCRQIGGRLDGRAMQTFDTNRRLRYLQGQRDAPERSAQR